MVVEKLDTLQVRSIGTVQNFLDCADCMLDVNKLCHRYFGRDHGSQTKCCCRVNSARQYTTCRANEIPSVTIPKVPSAPMKSLVVSKPVADFLARLRVFITSPEGNTAVLYSVNKNNKGCADDTHDI